jgi:hypothetical protein
MSSKSKTGDKLIASIRKSKTGTVARKTSERPDAAKSTAAKSKASTSSSASKSSSSASENQERQNIFSHGRRVWPD